MHTNTDIQSYLPLTETTLFIMLSLAPGPRHGYAIMKDVRALSHNRVELSTGTLYSALKRLLDQNWIRRTEDPDPIAADGGRVRKVYILTDLGKNILQAEVDRLQSLVGVARGRVLGNAQ
ncbi:MAG: PadR family transcriptional regulator [Chloroflexota bacterium]|nr:MAG: PadR family transcriptional regulator [Chloroflexota bacterium]